MDRQNKVQCTFRESFPPWIALNVAPGPVPEIYYTHDEIWRPWLLFAITMRAAMGWRGAVAPRDHHHAPAACGAQCASRYACMGARSRALTDEMHASAYVFPQGREHKKEHQNSTFSLMIHHAMF